MTKEQQKEAAIFVRDYKKYVSVYAAAVAFAKLHDVADLYDETNAHIIIMAKCIEYFISEWKFNPVMRSFRCIDYVARSNDVRMKEMKDGIHGCVKAILENEAACAPLLLDTIPVMLPVH